MHDPTEYEEYRKERLEQLKAIKLGLLLRRKDTQSKEFEVSVDDFMNDLNLFKNY